MSRAQYLWLGIPLLIVLLIVLAPFFAVPFIFTGYYLLCAYCDQSMNRDGSYGSWPFKNRGRNLD